MIVCSCNALTESDVRSAARAGARCPLDAYDRLGCQPECGACLCYAQEIIDEERMASRGGSNVVRLRSAA